MYRFLRFVENFRFSRNQRIPNDHRRVSRNSSCFPAFLRIFAAEIRDSEELRVGHGFRSLSDDNESSDIHKIINCFRPVPRISQPQNFAREISTY